MAQIEITTRPENIDEGFYARSDAFIQLANAHAVNVERGKVSASMLFGTARFNAWVAACSFASGEDMRGAKAELVAYFMKEYQTMLEEHLDDHVTHFERYMRPPEG